MRRYGSYIFDLDNTLVDSRRGYEKAFMTAFREFGMPYDPALYNEYISTPLAITFSHHHPNSPRRYRDFVAVLNITYAKTCLDGVRLFPDRKGVWNIFRKKGAGWASFRIRTCPRSERSCRGSGRITGSRR